MEFGEQDQEQVKRAGGWGELRSGPLWGAAALVLGVTLWAQLFWIGLGAEVQFDVPRPWAFIAYLMPLAMLAAGVWSRAPVILLTLFAGSFLPGLVLLAEPEQMLLMEGWSMLRVGACFALFLALVSAGSGEELEVGEVVAPQGISTQEVDHELRRFVAARLGVLLVLWCVPAYGVYLDPEIASMISVNYEDASDVGRVFLGVVHFFIWSVAAYMMVLVPSLNVEYDRRRMRRELKAFGKGLTHKKSWIRIGLYLLTSVLVVLGLLVLK